MPWRRRPAPLELLKSASYDGIITIEAGPNQKRGWRMAACCLELSHVAETGITVVGA